MISKKVLEGIISSGHYEILSSRGQFGQREALNGKMQEVAGYVLKDYINKFYSDKEKDYLTKNLSLEMLTKKHSVFPAGQKMVVRAPKGQAVIIKELMKEIERFYIQDVEEIPTLHFDNHLYSPIAIWHKGKRYQEIKTVPIKLNEGETTFLKHLRQYVKSVADKLKGKEIYVLRNLSQKGVGFFIESSSFYPDFILWVVEGKKQNIFFLDPKGIRNLGNFKDDKIVFCSDTIQEINNSIQQKIKNENLDIEVKLDAFILSISKFAAIKASWGNREATREDFKNNHVLFIEENKVYLNELFGDIIEKSRKRFSQAVKV